MAESTYVNCIIIVNFALVVGLVFGMCVLARVIFRIATQVDAIVLWLTTEFGDDDEPDPDEAPEPRDEREVIHWPGRAA